MHGIKISGSELRARKVHIKLQLFILATLLQPCKVVTRLSPGCGILYARCLQPCEVVATLYDDCEVVFHIVKVHSTSKCCQSYLYGYNQI